MPKEIRVVDNALNADTPGLLHSKGKYWIAWVEKAFGPGGFLSLSPGSIAIDSGVDLGLPFNGAAPDIGAIEFGTSFGQGGGPSTTQLAVIDAQSGAIVAPQQLAKNLGFAAFPTLTQAADRVAITWFDSRPTQGRDIFGALASCN